MKILFTGASSFTGYWFVKILAAAGHMVVCPVTGSLDRYQGVRQRRILALQEVAELVPDSAFGTEAFLQLVRKHDSWDLLCHHAADVTNYRSPDFDFCQALRNNTLQLDKVLQELKPKGLRGIVLTGSVFENDEGAGTLPLRAFSPYGLSKGLTYQAFRYYCERAGLPLGKFVIPNPFGPYEEARFTAHLLNHWKDSKVPSVKTPDYKRDNIPVDLLADAYALFSAQVATGAAPLTRLNPSGYVETQGEFTLRVAREVRTRTGWACDVQLEKQVDFNEPLQRVNLTAAAPLVPAWEEPAFWDSFVEFYRSAA